MQTIDVVIKNIHGTEQGEGGSLSCLGNSFSLHPSNERILYEKLIQEKKVPGAHAPENEPQQDQRFGLDNIQDSKAGARLKPRTAPSLLLELEEVQFPSEKCNLLL